jgi:phosphatidylethanolamine-binding protein (PEBP) family uncharacterized protein
MHDPDVALQGKTDDVLHWLVFNIPGSARELALGIPPETKLRDGTIRQESGQRSRLSRTWRSGAGPHHHYTWELFGLDTQLDLGLDAPRP